jgi:hypothetical protein
LRKDFIFFLFKITRNQSAGCYSGHIILEEQIQTISSQSSETHGYSDVLTTSKRREEVHKKQNNLDYRTDEDEDFSNKMEKSPSTSSSPLEFGRFCGQMSVSTNKRYN